jgi:nucleotide-binding universal stress UspA family protein
VFFETDLGFIPLSVSVTRPAQNFVRVKDKASVMPGTSSVVHIILADEVGIAVAKTPGSEDADAQIADVAKYLDRHDVRVGQQISTVATEDEDVLLLDLARQHRVNLIVAGAYGRTRLSEWIFGGVTRHLLLNSPIPCLLSN